MILLQEDKLFIKQYKQISNFTSYQIDVELLQGIVHIYGSELGIHYYSKDEIYIIGKIRTITFL